MNTSIRCATINRTSFLVAIGFVTMLLAANSNAQDSPTSKPLLSGQPYVVWKMYHDFKTPVEPITDFAKLPQARGYANALNDKLKLSDGFHYSVHERQNDKSDKTPSTSDPPAAGKLDLFKGLREKPWIDVAPSGSTTNAGVSSPATKGKGLVDTAKVTIDFRRDGTFVIDGEYAATGKWKVLANSRILLEGRDVRFSGLVQGKTIKGKFGRLGADGEVERTPDGSPIIRDWSADLTTELTSSLKVENTSLKSTRWVAQGDRPDDRTGWEFDGGTVVTFTYSDGETLTGSWEQKDSAVIVTAKSSAGVFRMEGKIADDRRTVKMTYSNGKTFVLQAQK